MKPYFESDGVTLYCADCFDVLPHLSGIGALVTDPPYSSGGAFRGDRMASAVSKYVNTDTLVYRPDFAGDNRDQRSFLSWCSLWLCAARKAMVEGGPVACFSDWRQVPVMTDALQCAGFVWRGLATWWKPGIRMQRGRFSSSAEFVVWGTNGPALDHDGCPQNVTKCAPVDDKKHVAEKPVPVMAWCLGVVPPGSVVLDPFMGTGSTLRAAANAGMKAVGIDADERYVELAAKRLEQRVFRFAE